MMKDYKQMMNDEGRRMNLKLFILHRSSLIIQEAHNAQF